ncbi:beta-scruin [Caerostris extrusa]|uniref:Beta-scruin n=1 Tax=Caerostris extrusa TaxID=172846 RepID=A0AAV4Y3H9_CAEEX|nr:beta-scruin [Caerostris extrusa]
MMKVKEKIFCSKVQDKNQKKSSDSSLEIKEGTKSEKSYSKLLPFLDPNLGLLPYLPPLEIIYEAKMNQPWNIAPYFLDILPQSPCCNLDDCILLFGGLNPFKPDDFVQ